MASQKPVLTVYSVKAEIKYGYGKSAFNFRTRFHLNLTMYHESLGHSHTLYYIQI